MKIKFSPGPHYIFYFLLLIAFIFTIYLRLTTSHTKSGDLKEDYRRGGNRRSYNPQGVFGIGSRHRPVNYYNVSRNTPWWRRWGWGSPYYFNWSPYYGGYWNEKNYLNCKEDCEENYDTYVEEQECIEDCQDRYDPIFE